MSERYARTNPVMLMLIFACCLLIAATNATGQNSTAITSMGFRASEGGGGALTTVWTTGNLGNTWAEGEWVPYQLVISNVQADYPNMTNLPNIVMEYDFTAQNDARFVDLVRSIQVGTTQLTDAQGWPRDNGSAYPMTTRTEIEQAQNDYLNGAPLQNIWTGFTLLNLPNSQVHRAAPPTFGVGTPSDQFHYFYITRQNLIDAGVDSTANTIIIYYQLHESRSFVWSNSLQEQYDQSPTDDWGGYLYSLASYANDTRFGAGYVPGSSGQIRVSFGGGDKTVPIPIPERLPGAVSGLKWADNDGNGAQNGSEPTLSGWRVYVRGTLEGITFADTTLTDGSGNYSFPNLTSGTTWYITEEAQRTVPVQSGYDQTYPTGSSVMGVGSGWLVNPPDLSKGAYGWQVPLTLADTGQGNLNFGNKLCQPELACPPDDTVECDESTDTSATGRPTIVQACDSSWLTYSDQQTPGPCANQYTIARRWILTATSGLADTCVQHILVVDLTPPVVTCPPDTSFQCISDVPSPDPSLVSAVDNCDLDPTPAFLRDDTAGSCPTIITRYYTATDACGNADTCAQTITVDDTTKPVLSGCPSNARYSCDATIPGPANVTANDNCDGPITPTYSQISTPGSCANAYTLTRKWVAVDDCGNKDSCMQTITVYDETPPVVTCPDPIFVQCLDDVPAADTSLVTATDNCDTSPTKVWLGDTPTEGSCPKIFLRAYAAFDNCNNADTCFQYITVNDTIDPVISGVGSGGTVECPNTPTWSDPSASDNCDDDPLLTHVDSTFPGSCPQEYSIKRTWKAVDACNNTTYASETFNITDNTKPALSGCPDNASYTCLSQVPPPANVTANDLCAGAITPTFSENQSNPGSSCNNTITRKWVATDPCGNADSCMQTITVNDNVKPTLSGCPSNASYTCITLVPTPPNVTANDNCDSSVVPVFSESQSNPGSSCNNTITRKWVATDDCGNKDSCMQTITVNDNVKPTLAGCPADTTLACSETVPSPASVTAADNCDSSLTPAFTQDSTAGDCRAEYRLVRKWVATDDCGNKDSCMQTIDVVDTTGPVLTCATDTTINCGEPVTFTEPSVDADCTEQIAVWVLSTDSTVGPGAGQMTYTRCWVALDSCNMKTDTCCQNIIRQPCEVPCTFTMGGWGSDCPESQAADMYSTQPGCIRDHYFTTVFPNGVIIGDPAGPGGSPSNWYSVKWTSSAAVSAFLPAGGTPRPLKKDLTDPITTPAGVLAGQILALKLNVGYSCANIFGLLDISPDGSCYGSFVIPVGCGDKFDGITVDSFLVICDKVVGGQTSVLSAFDAKASDVVFTATCLNELYDACDPTVGTIYTAPEHSEDDDVTLPKEVALASNYPNPFNPATVISFSLPTAMHVKIEVFNLLGQRVATLLDDTKGAGNHAVTWDATDKASGIYLYRLTTDDLVLTKKMLLIK